MYQQFYHLDACPFELTPNPRYLLLTPTHREALSALEYGIAERKGVTLLVGEAGTGKTTLLRKALALKLAATSAKGTDCVYINNPSLTPAELFERLALDFRIEETPSKTIFLRRFEDALEARRLAGRRTALVIDEAQSVPDALFEQLRLLTNIESDEVKFLPLVLAGQPELADRLNEHRWRQFKQRIVLRCELAALNLQETATYIFGRIRLAGGDGTQLFTRDAVLAIYHASLGIPRTISVICDNALLSGFALQRRPVDADIVAEVCRDLDLTPAAGGDRQTPAERVTPVRPLEAVNRWPRSVR
jgi:general secretion pathway protein A